MQINHKFEGFNAEFCYLTHPIYGDIRGTRATRNIEKGEEIFHHYAYNLDDQFSPRWYREGQKLFEEEKWLVMKLLRFFPRVRKSSTQFQNFTVFSGN